MTTTRDHPSISELEPDRPAADLPAEAAAAALAGSLPMDSPIDTFLRAFDRLDPDACAALLTDHGRFRYVDGHVDEGPAAVRDQLREDFADLDSTVHTLHGQWHDDGVWIAEVEASYVLADHSELGPLSLALIVRASPAGIEDIRVYTAVEPWFRETMVQHREYDQGTMVGGHWLPPL